MEQLVKADFLLNADGTFHFPLPANVEDFPRRLAQCPSGVEDFFLLLRGHSHPRATVRTVCDGLLSDWLPVRTDGRGSVARMSVQGRAHRLRDAQRQGLNQPLVVDFQGNDK